MLVKTKMLLSAGALVFVADFAYATSLPVANPSWEIPALGDDTVVDISDANVGGWQTNLYSRLYNPAGNGVGTSGATWSTAVPDGDQVYKMDKGGNPFGAYATQNINWNFEAGQIFTFSFDVGNSWENATPFHYAMRVYAQTNTNADYMFLKTHLTNPVPDGQWVHVTGSFTVPAGYFAIGDPSAHLLVNLTNGHGYDTTDGQDDIYYDNIRIDAATAPTSAEWNVDNDGNWSLGSNWNPATAPNGAGAIANFGTKITAPHTVTVDAPQTVGHISFDNTNAAYTVAGSSTLTLDTDSGDVDVTMVHGTGHTISAPLVLAKNATFNVTPAGVASRLIISNLQASNVDITKQGDGVLVVNNLRAKSINTFGGGVEILPGRSTDGTSRLNALNIPNTFTYIDTADQDVVVDYSGASPLAEIAAKITTGYASGAWNGPGIRSVSAAAASSDPHPTGIGFGEASAVGLANGVFSGQNLDADAVLLRYTYLGDTNLDGQVDVIDLGNLATSWQAAGSWVNGDSNYDGAIDVIDLGLLATNWQAGVGSPLGPGSLDQALAAYGLPSVGVPEPALVGLLGMALLGVRSKRSAR